MTKKEILDKEECFVLMPISDEANGKEKGHFANVYNNLFKPAIEAAGYKAVLASDVKETNLIHHDILNRLISAPMALCDLSTLNANVFFELGIRQSFDMPVVLVQEADTKRVFDISGIRSLEYRNGNQYHEVIEDQKKIKEAIEATKNGKGINSLISLLSMTSSAKLNDLDNNTDEKLLKVILDELNALRDKFDSQSKESKQSITLRNQAELDNFSAKDDNRKIRMLEETVEAFIKNTDKSGKPKKNE